jgi:hypothetical protein
VEGEEVGVEEREEPRQQAKFVLATTPSGKMAKLICVQI